MKKVGFKRKIKIEIDWHNPFLSISLLFLFLALFSLVITVLFGALKEDWDLPATLGGISVFFGLLYPLNKYA